MSVPLFAGSVRYPRAGTWPRPQKNRIAKMEPIAALNQLMKESHKYILTMYADGSYLHILLQHTENRDSIVTERLPIGSTQQSLEEAVFSQPVLTPGLREGLLSGRLAPLYLHPQRFRLGRRQPALLQFLFPRQRRHRRSGRAASYRSADAL